MKFLSRLKVDVVCYMLTSLVSLQQVNVKKTGRDSGAGFFSCEFGVISKNTFFTNHLRTIASFHFSKLRKIVLVLDIGVYQGSRQFSDSW